MQIVQPALLVAWLGACAPTPKIVTASAPRAAALYQLDFELVSTGADSGPVRRAYSVNLAEGGHGNVSSGSNVVMDPGHSRMDVGTRISCSLERRGDTLVLEQDLELSYAYAEASTVHKARSHGSERIRVGQPARIAAFDDITGRVHTELTVKVTQL